MASALAVAIIAAWFVCPGRRTALRLVATTTAILTGGLAIALAAAVTP